MFLYGSMNKAGKRVPAKRGRPRSVDVEVRWQHILNVAAVVLLRDGYAGASIAKIAREGGVSKKTIYAKYSSKTELTAEVLRHLFQKSLDRLALVAKREHGGLVPILLDFATTVLNEATSPVGIGLYRILIAENSVSKQLPDLYAEVRGHWDAPLSKVLRTFMDKGELRRDDPVLLARTFYQLTVGELRERALLGGSVGKTAIRKTAASAVDIMLAAYAAKRAGEEVAACQAGIEFSKN